MRESSDAAAAEQPPVTDIHTHAGNFHQIEAGEHDALLAELVADMDRGGVARSVVLPVPMPPGTRNADRHNQRFIAGVAAHDGDRLVPFCTVDFDEPETARRQLRDAVAAGARGLKIHPIVQLASLEDPAVVAAFEEAAALGVPVLAHTGQFLGAGQRIAGEARPLGPLDLARPLPIDRVAGDLPELRIVLAHFGWPWADEAIAIAQRRENVWLDLSGWAPRHIPDSVWVQMSKARPDRFLFGTDYPFLASERWLREFRQRGVPHEAAIAVTSVNAGLVLGDES